ncbi:hypothetical protein D4Q52_16940 [Rhodopseudomonas palustris]|uniref:Uncharacterized protein n=1 Tax=Rhodopseudomonas palustris TaxID=1076 RepID=A0A418V348_RHOPL|nr:hypothetical protein D4Q52_16940 [Rhodopseudomonas palustris]
MRAGPSTNTQTAAEQSAAVLFAAGIVPGAPSPQPSPASGRGSALRLFQSAPKSAPASLRAQRSNPGAQCTELDCFAEPVTRNADPLARNDEVTEGRLYPVVPRNCSTTSRRCGRRRCSIR